MENIRRILRTEPALITAVAVAVIDLLAAYGLDVPQETLALVTAVLAVAQGLATRSKTRSKALSIPVGYRKVK